MKDLIAKRYIKALANSLTYKELEEIVPLLSTLAGVTAISKFREIIESPYIESTQKVDFILQKILENRANTKLTNFIKVLANHKRLTLFGELYDELASYLAILNKRYIAQLIVNESCDDAIIKEIESKFSKKLGVNLLLRQRIVANAGIKLIIHDLGLEISFSKEKFINDLRNYILRAF